MRQCRLLLTFFIVIASTAFGQKITDLSGGWNGSIRVPINKYQVVEFFFTQNGAALDGYVIAKSIHSKDSSKALFSGAVTPDGIDLKESKFVYKTGMACLANIKLKYSSDASQERLIGKWSGDWGLNTCPPGVTGKVELVKIPTERHEPPPTDLSLVKIDSTDTYGVQLYNALKSRNYFALLIGIDQYEDESIQDLEHPVTDKNALQQVLQTDYKFTPEHTITLENPARDQIIEAFDELTKIVTDKDQLLIFYAGHGVWDEQMQQGYWLPADAKTSSKSRWISNGTIRDYLGGIHSKHTLLIADACFGGGILKDRAVNLSNGRAMMEMYRLPSRKAMTSGMLSTVPDKSVFVQYLIKNLKKNVHPLLSAEDLFRTFKIAVINNSGSGQVPQFGTISQSGDEGGDFIFLRQEVN